MRPRSVVLALLCVVAVIACGESRRGIHPLNVLLYRCEGQWVIDPESAARFPGFASGRERLGIEVTSRLPTPEDGSWTRNAKYADATVSFDDAKVPVDLVMSDELFGPYAVYRGPLSLDANMDPAGFAIDMLIVEPTDTSDKANDWLLIDYRKQRPPDVNLDRDLVRYVRKTP